MINTIIFSKDRASQLDLLLRSMDKYFKINDRRISILYTWSSDAYKKGYEILRDLYGNRVNFVIESHFKNDTVALLSDKFPFTLCLTDDVWFKRITNDTDIEYKILLTNNKIVALTYGLGHNIKFWFYDDPMLLPPFNADGTYEWNRATHKVWRYSMASTTHVWRTSEVMPYIQKLSFMNPNQMETDMVKHPINKPLMLCYPKNRLIVFTVNQSQITHKGNRVGGLTCEYFNDKWLNGYKIQSKNLYSLDDTILAPLEVDFLFSKKDQLSINNDGDIHKI